MEIQINRKVYNKIMHWVNHTDIEVSGFGKVIWYPETKVFDVVDAFLLPQEGGAAHTEIDAEGLGKLLYTTRDTPGELNFWWHSHVNMSVFWSGQDTETIKSFGKQGWITATVFNKKYEHRSAVAYLTKSNSELLGKEQSDVTLIDNVSTFIMDDVSDADRDAWNAEFAANVREKKHEPVQYNFQSEWSWQGDDMPLWKGHTAAVKREKSTYAASMGLLGYGLDVEAFALGMSTEAYQKQLDTKNFKTLTRLEDKLERLMLNGKLDAVSAKFES